MNECVFVSAVPGQGRCGMCPGRHLKGGATVQFFYLSQASQPASSSEKRCFPQMYFLGLKRLRSLRARNACFVISGTTWLMGIVRPGHIL